MVSTFVPAISLGQSCREAVPWFSDVVGDIQSGRFEISSALV